MIVKVADIKAAVNALLMDNFKSIGIYGVDEAQGNVEPYFFVEILLKSTPETKIFNDNSGSIIITYVQKHADELDALNTYDVIRGLFRMHFKVKDRYLNVESVDYTWAGQDSNKLQANIDFSYKDTNEKINKYKTMEHLGLRERMDE